MEYEVRDVIDKIKSDYERIKSISKNEQYYAVVKKGDKYGVVDWESG